MLIGFSESLLWCFCCQGCFKKLLVENPLNHMHAWVENQERRPEKCMPKSGKFQTRYIRSWSDKVVWTGTLLLILRECLVNRMAAEEFSLFLYDQLFLKISHLITFLVHPQMSFMNRCLNYTGRVTHFLAFCHKLFYC